MLLKKKTSINQGKKAIKEYKYTGRFRSLFYFLPNTMLPYTEIHHSPSGSLVLVIQFFAHPLVWQWKELPLMIHCYTDLCQHNQKPPAATKGWHQVDGVATKQRRHIRVTPLPYNSTFSTNCGMDFELLRCGRLGKGILELKRHGVGVETTTPHLLWHINSLGNQTVLNGLVLL